MGSSGAFLWNGFMSKSETLPPVSKMKCLGGQGNASWVKCLLHKCEDLGLDHQNPCQSGYSSKHQFCFCADGRTEGVATDSPEVHGSDESPP